MVTDNSRLVFLGTAQDGGVPQAGCRCYNCQRFRRSAASIALLRGSDAVLIDCSPDFRQQHDFLLSNYDVRVSAIYLTHAHWGHYGGLMQLGREGWNTGGMPVYMSERFLDFLSVNKPFAALISSGNIKPHVFTGQEQSVHGVSAVSIVHRDEYTDMHGFRINFGDRSVLYAPDADYFDDALISEIRSVDLAIIDGTFYNRSELPGRDLTSIPHPFICEAVNLFADVSQRVIFTHLNHSNPLLDRDSSEYSKVVALGFRVADDGDSLTPDEI